MDGPGFLDDETLTDNLNDDEAKRITNWLIVVFKNLPSDLEWAILVARGLNGIFANGYTDSLLDYFSKTMSILEKEYAKPETI